MFDLPITPDAVLPVSLDPAVTSGGPYPPPPPKFAFLPVSLDPNITPGYPLPPPPK
jgi:hypothetical protein